jgi:response regulator RpfG family c-di-GMP phosphodiesterase
MNILLIDDEKDCLSDLVSSLKPTGYQIDTETNPLMSLERFKNHHYDVIISDVGMKELSGLDLLKKMKQHDHSIRVIIITAYQDMDTIKESFDRHAYAFYHKPVDIDKLILKLREIESEIVQESGKKEFYNRLASENIELKEQSILKQKHEEKLIESVQSEILTVYQEIEENQKEIVIRLSEVAEMRSKETGNHVLRVAEYSQLLALHYQLDYKSINLIKAASPMHDIGKVAIPDSILNKAGPLTKEEFELMKDHTTYGSKILGNSRLDLLKIASLISLEHHEKYNGKGYPRGLKGNEISIEGRIVALADVFDALASDRCYKKAWEMDRIIELITTEKGEHFDPDLTDIFLKKVDSFIEVKERLKDSF